MQFKAIIFTFSTPLTEKEEDILAGFFQGQLAEVKKRLKRANYGIEILEKIPILNKELLVSVNSRVQAIDTLAPELFPFETEDKLTYTFSYPSEEQLTKFFASVSGINERNIIDLFKEACKEMKREFNQVRISRGEYEQTEQDKVWKNATQLP